MFLAKETHKIFCLEFRILIAHTERCSTDTQKIQIVRHFSQFLRLQIQSLRINGFQNHI